MKRLILLLTLCMAYAATVEAQSLADFARQERERRKNLESKMTISNDSSKSAPAVPIASKEDKPEQTAVAAAKQATGPTDRQGRNEKWWRDAFAKTRKDLNSAENQVKVLELQLNQAQRDYMEKTSLYNREMVLAAEMNAVQSDLDKGKGEVVRLRQQLAQMEEDLRRSGGPAGWAR